MKFQVTFSLQNKVSNMKIRSPSKLVGKIVFGAKGSLNWFFRGMPTQDHLPYLDQMHPPKQMDSGPER